ncbi:MAG: hypothetical protein ACE5I2_11555 [Anaerolineae bacterium]
MSKKAIKVALGILFLAVFLHSSVIPPYRTFDYRMGAVVAGYQFSFARWEAGAITRKLGQMLTSAPERLSEEEKKATVLDYLSLIQRTGQLEQSIQQTYSTVEDDPAAAALPLRQELAELRQRQAEKQGQVEAILEEQITQVVLSQDLDTLRIVWPPVKFQFESLPLYLVISPRQEIRVKKAVYLEHGLGLDTREAIEEEIDETFDVSSLTVGVGGLSAYPAMIVEAASLNFIVKAAAHEWTHGYLFFRPLGWHYEDSPQMRTINETVASIVGDEVGALVIARFYPELAPPPIEKSEEQPQPEPVESEFNREMRHIRLAVDEMLARGDVAGAEEYMEERRRFLVSRGYYIRKLNQAYFAFYGSYATSPTSVDPIGEALQRLRRESASLKEFVDTMAAMTSHEELWRILGEQAPH